MQLPPEADTDGRAFNIGTGEARSVNEIFAKLSELTGYRQPPQPGPFREADQMLAQLDSSRAQELFGWSPEVSWDEGLRLTAQWFKDNYDLFD